MSRWAGVGSSSLPSAAHRPTDFWAARRRLGEHHLYDLGDDRDEERNRRGEPLERRIIELLRSALEEGEAPEEQYRRMGIA